MTKPTKTAEFLRAMQMDQAEPPEARTGAPATPIPTPGPKKPTSRTGLKHFGAYLDDDTLEKIALLRVRLKMDNSELTKLAIDDLHRKHLAKRAFGDA
jgi:hypothetical protein